MALYLERALASETIARSNGDVAVQASVTAQTATITAAANAYQFLIMLAGRFTSQPAAGDYVIDGNVLTSPALVGTAGSDMGIFYIDPADFPAVGSLTAKWRARFAVWIPSSTAPACDVTMGFYNAGALASGGMSVFGSQLGSDAVFSAPAAGSKNVGSSGTFTAPGSSTFFAVKCSLSAQPAANSVIAVRAILERNSQ